MKKSDFDRIKEDLLFINKNYYEFSIALSIPKTNDFNVIGTSHKRFSYDTYVSDFKEMEEKKLFSLKMTDGSYIVYEYIFHKLELISAKISYIPFYESELFHNISMDNIISKYIRIDFDYEGYVPFNHPLIHLHNNLSKDGIRFAIDNIIYPSEFLFFILRYVYKKDKIKKLEDHMAILKKQSKILINQNELNNFYFKT